MPARMKLSSRVILWLKLVTSALEVVVGALLAVLGAAHLDVSRWVRRAARGELREDPADVVAHHILRSLHTIRWQTELTAGLLIVAYGAVKGGVIVATLRGDRRAAAIGVVLFGAIAIGASVLLLTHLTPWRIVLAALDVAVAVVLWREVLAARSEPAR